MDFAEEVGRPLPNGGREYASGAVCTRVALAPPLLGLSIRPILLKDRRSSPPFFSPISVCPFVVRT